jgi:AraC-like DNA-binding protein
VPEDAETVHGITSEFRTSDPNRAHEWMRETFVDYEPRQSSVPRTFRFRGSHTALGNVTVGRIRFPMPDDVMVPGLGVVVVTHVLNGRFSYATGQGDVVAVSGNAILIPHQQEITVTWDDLDTGGVLLRPADVARVAAETTGIGEQDLRFSGGLPVSSTAERHWHGAVGYVTRAVLPNPEAAKSALIQAEASRLLAVALLTTFENNAMTFTEHRPDGVTPAALRRAVAFIADNAHSPITITDIAAAAGTGPRAVQHAFREHLNTTPTAYAKRVRLEGAHRELHAADPSRGATVARIAAAWGFAHPGRFATAYRQLYGSTPVQTLRA